MNRIGASGTKMVFPKSMQSRNSGSEDPSTGGLHQWIGGVEGVVSH